MPLDFTDDKSALVQVMAWCRQATSHYLSQCWPRSLTPKGVTRPQWVKPQWANCYIFIHKDIQMCSDILEAYFEKSYQYLWNNQCCQRLFDLITQNLLPTFANSQVESHSDSICGYHDFTAVCGIIEFGRLCHLGAWNRENKKINTLKYHCIRVDFLQNIHHNTPPTAFLWGQEFTVRSTELLVAFYGAPSPKWDIVIVESYTYTINMYNWTCYHETYNLIF